MRETDYLDLASWPRYQHFLFFKGMDYPQFNICANLDITLLRPYLKGHGYPFFKTVLYLATRTANQIPEFRFRIRGDQVVVHDQVHPSFTFLTRPELFSFCTAPYNENVFEFFKGVDAATETLGNRVNLADEPGRDDLLYITSLPWVSFTGITHPVHMHPADSIPRISWGKFFEENGKIKLPFSIQAHHALMDGIHVGRYFEMLQDMVDHPGTYFETKPL